jgi:predicted TIM-barrel fold metal-dependent hydrolase
VSEPPEFYFRRQVYACFFRDNFGLKNLDDIGVDNVTFETDYPHSDSTWPHTEQFVREMAVDLDDETLYKIVRGNAIKMLHLDLV